ncbi:unnamed protein product [Spirodela intermedia]|uniref:Carboxypeptidase n=1 Tax=Spirodela intermedia TaxID=51605 RepID=A0A7I8JPZ5_SPIIN|nr:unnamed protein product [Spirodela intermedia]CAA6672237.1 unnamed protein product [Spirodela intermedia]
MEEKVGRGVPSSGIFALLLVLLLVSHCCSGVRGVASSGVREEDKVLQLPGQSFNVSFAHYSGYITVNEESGGPSFTGSLRPPRTPPRSPSGDVFAGPGCSSVAYGLAEEVGPFHINPDGKSLYLNSYSWNQAANIIFLDSPVGVGYSYSNNSKDIQSNGDERTAKDSLEFLKNWFKEFPDYSGRDFYLAGESYAGHYIPQLSQAIVRSQKLTEGSSINLKGFMVGNALTDDFRDRLGIFQFMWLLNLFCDFQSFVHISPQCNRVLDLADEEIGNIDPYSIFTPSCTQSGSFSRTSCGRGSMMGEKYDPCTEQHSTVYFNLPEVHTALHVHPAATQSKWETCSDLVDEYWKDSQRSILPIYHELIATGYASGCSGDTSPLADRAVIYHTSLFPNILSSYTLLNIGDNDAVIPVTSTRYNINAMKLQTVTPWHAWYDDGQVGGWTQVYKGLSFVTVRGAGHEVPLHKPKLALVLFRAFLSDSPCLPSRRSPILDSNPIDTGHKVPQTWHE